jgi:hypothetical protein
MPSFCRLLLLLASLLHLLKYKMMAKTIAIHGLEDVTQKCFAIAFTVTGKQNKENDMKKKLVALALITGLTMATVASAGWGRGHIGYGDCPQVQGQMFQQLDQGAQDKIQQFFKDTRPLHKEMAMKRAEKQALLQSDTPDPQAVAKVTGELFDLKTSMREKAELAGVDQYVGHGRMGRNGGMGRMGGMGRTGGMGHKGGMGMGHQSSGHGCGQGQGGGMMNNGGSL